jgi:hypothetical protein
MLRTPGNRIFISYRRDDAAGYAGRLEASLERRLGGGSVFRDVQDIAPGANFVHEIQQQLAGAEGVMVLIGPRWAGGEVPGQRRIDDPQDFVRLEVQAALASPARVVPVLLPGVTMPAEDDLPEPLKPLARRHALSIADPHWDADIDRLLASLGQRRQRVVWPWALGGAAVAGAVVAAVYALWPGAAVDDGAQLIGRWQADVRYDWGDSHTEHFEFTQHAGSLTGTADYLRYPRAIEQLTVDGTNLRFQTRSTETMGSQDREKTHHYTAELRGQPPDEVLAFRLHTTGGFGSHRPISFEARRAATRSASP